MDHRDEESAFVWRGSFAARPLSQNQKAQTIVDFLCGRNDAGDAAPVRRVGRRRRARSSGRARVIGDLN